MLSHGIVPILLFILTALLCVGAEVSRKRWRARTAAGLALVTVTMADVAMLSQRHEFSLTWGSVAEERAPARKRRQQREELDQDGGAGGERVYRDRGAAQGAGKPGEDDTVVEEEEDEEPEVRMRNAPAPGAALFQAIVTALSPPKASAVLTAAWSKVKDCPSCPDMIVVPAGETVIGSSWDDAEADSGERPQRLVRFWPGFAIARVEISRRDLEASGWKATHGVADCGTGANAELGEPGEAVTCISWDEAAGYAAWLTAITGKRYRLPSAAEWEYAARLFQLPQRIAAADGDMAAGGERAVAMGGGVGELVGDCWVDMLDLGSETSAAYLPERTCYRRILKDGADSEREHWKRPAARRPMAQGARSALVGFRVVRELDEASAFGR